MKKILDKIKGWKTMCVAGVTAALGFIQSTDLGKIITDPRVMGYVLLSVGIIMAILRTVTTTPVGQSAPAPAPPPPPPDEPKV